MSRWLKIGAAVFGGLVLLVAGALSAAYSMQPDHFRISRSRTIPASAAVIRPHLIELRELETWAPRNTDRRDPPVVVFSEVTSGVGAWVERTGKRSSSRMTIAEITDSLVRFDFESTATFGQAHTTLELRLTEKSAGATEVEYVLNGKLDGVPRLLWSVVGLEDRVGPDVDEALQKLEAKCVP